MQPNSAELSIFPGSAFFLAGAGLPIALATLGSVHPEWL